MTGIILLNLVNSDEASVYSDEDAESSAAWKAAISSGRSISGPGSTNASQFCDFDQWKVLAFIVFRFLTVSSINSRGSDVLETTPDFPESGRDRETPDLFEAAELSREELSLKISHSKI